MVKRIIMCDGRTEELESGDKGEKCGIVGEMAMEV